MSRRNTHTSFQEVGPRSALRTVQILYELSSCPSGLSLAALSSRLQLPKTSVFRLLRGLESTGYVVSKENIHRVGPEAFKLGAAIVQNQVFPNCAQAAMERLYERCSETVIIGVLSDSGNDVVYASVIEAQNNLRFTVNPGTVRPLYCSASGQTILAFMDSTYRDGYFKSVNIQPLASNTIRDVDALIEKVDEVRVTGVAISIDGMYEGVYSIAAPIFDAKGAVPAGISISAPKSRAPKKDATWANYVLEAGEEVSRILGYTGSYPPVV